MEGAPNPHRLGRAGAAAAAAASEMLPINGKRPLKRTRQPTDKPPARAPREAHHVRDTLRPAPPAGEEAAGPSSSSSQAAAAVPDGLPLSADLVGDVDALGGGGAGVDAAACAGGGTGRVSKPPDMPPPPLPRNAQGKLPLLQERAGIDADEAYGSQELALSSYLKLHPVLSLEATSHQTLQLVSDLVGETAIPTKELEIVPKSWDDAYLRPPNLAANERACNFGNRCICVWLARWRYGDDTDLAFVGAEFLRPSQREVFDRTGKLPSPPGKCLVCTRYVHTYIYRCARGDPTFCPSAKVPLQAFGNALGVASGEDVPGHASVANDSDGYRQEALLFVDEEWADTAAARGGMASLLWRPVVKFFAPHYAYVRDDNQMPRLIQRDVGAAQESTTQHFGPPAEGTTTPSSASSVVEGEGSPRSSA